MRRRLASAGLLFLAAFAGPAAAQEGPQIYNQGVTQPRVPLGPGLRQEFNVQFPNTETVSQLPGYSAALPREFTTPQWASFISARVGESEISIFSLAAQKLGLAWYDPGARSWRVEEVAQGSVTRIVCTACQGTVLVSFNDGSQQQSFNFQLGRRLILQAESGRWTLKPFEG
ncbi:hypothetical protein [Afifella sp. IM 167]|uniref:hypothetical protein n=1 Tax=Afifella sp. IM 167 TaxID=2033586 RepID=UPI001CCF5F0F|nr:hypothetical protein [Afifella sp. IM 167]MBZ8133954.1 hypothetical protein [Afifella sp. IM 167]